MKREEIRDPFARLRIYFLVPFTYGSSLLSESPEQARKDSVCKLYTNRMPHLGIIQIMIQELLL